MRINFEKLFYFWDIYGGVYFPFFKNFQNYPLSNLFFFFKFAIFSKLLKRMMVFL